MCRTSAARQRRVNSSWFQQGMMIEASRSCSLSVMVAPARCLSLSALGPLIDPCPGQTNGSWHPRTTFPDRLLWPSRTECRRLSYAGRPANPRPRSQATHFPHSSSKTTSVPLRPLHTLEPFPLHIKMRLVKPCQLSTSTALSETSHGTIPYRCAWQKL